MIRNLWAFLVGDWHRSDIRRTLWWASAVTAFCLASMAVAVSASGWLDLGPGASDLEIVAASMFVGVTLCAVACFARYIVWDCWLAPEIEHSARQGQQIIRTREQSRRERGQLSVRDQGGELSEVE